MVLTALMCSVLSSRSMVKPITAMISHLRKSEDTGLLLEFREQLSSIREIRDLTSSFNHAAGAVREARGNTAARLAQNPWDPWRNALDTMIDWRIRPDTAAEWANFALRDGGGKR